MSIQKRLRTSVTTAIRDSRNLSKFSAAWLQSYFVLFVFLPVRNNWFALRPCQSKSVDVRRKRQNFNKSQQAIKNHRLPVSSPLYLCYSSLSLAHSLLSLARITSSGYRACQSYPSDIEVTSLGQSFSSFFRHRYYLWSHPIFLIPPKFELYSCPWSLNSSIFIQPHSATKAIRIPS